MIVIDTSALVAIVQHEPEADGFVRTIEADREARMSCANYVEASIVLEGRMGVLGRAAFEAALERLHLDGLRVVDMNINVADLAREAFRRYGKGRHPARLNFGDCFAYALAKALDAPLLYKGGDFDKTDVQRA